MANTKITSNVLESIANRIKPNGFSSSNGKALLVFNGSTIELDNKLKYLQEFKSEGRDFSIGFSFMAENILDTNKIVRILKPMEVFKEEDVFKLQSIANDYSMIIGPNITINTLSKVALGMIDSLIPTMIWTFLYQSKKVYLDFSSVRNYLGNETASKEILDIINRNIQTIIKMGAIEIDNSYINTISINSDSLIKDASTSKKELITERDIMNLSASQVLNIEKGTIITPLAKDRAKELGIKTQIR